MTIEGRNKNRKSIRGIATLTTCSAKEQGIEHFSKN